MTCNRPGRLRIVASCLLSGVVLYAQPASPQPPTDKIERVEILGAARVPGDSLRALVSTKPGDIYEQEALERDVATIWNTGRFDDVWVERKAGATGWIVYFAVLEAPTSRPPSDKIEKIEVNGAHRVPAETLRALLAVHAGDPYDKEALRRYFVALWHTGRFDDLRIQREAGSSGWIVRVTVLERNHL